MFNFWRRRSSAAKAAPQPTNTNATYIFGRGRTEINRLDMQHYLFRLVFHGDYSAPVHNPSNILDVACGTGLWAANMAQRFPDATVFGFDKNTAQFNVPRLLPNCTLVAGDALAEFPFSANDFDMVMARANSAYVPRDRWPGHLLEMLRVARSGGWIEIRDFSVVESRSPAIASLTAVFTQLAERIGIYPGVGPYIETLFQKTPLRDVRIQHKEVVAHPRAFFERSQGGTLMINDYLAVLQRVTPLVDRLGLVGEHDWEALLEAGIAESRRFPSKVILTSAIGRKP